MAVSFASLGLQEVSPALRVRQDPTEVTYQVYEESGVDLGQVLTKKEKISEMKSAMSADVAKALGKVSGGLYVVTAAQAGPAVTPHLTACNCCTCARSPPHPPPLSPL